MENAEVVAMLGEIADLLELTSENPFKIRAYRRAAQVVDTLPVPVAELARKGELAGLPGIGAHTAERIAQLVETGTCDALERLRGKVPPGVMELLRVESVGPKTAAQVWKEPGHHLRRCAGGGRAQWPPVRAAAHGRQTLGGHRLGHRALPVPPGPRPAPPRPPYAETLVEGLRADSGREAGHRRGQPAAAQGDGGGPGPAGVLDRPRARGARLPQAARGGHGARAGADESHGAPARGVAGGLARPPPESFGAALHYFTGSKAHNIALRTRAVRGGSRSASTVSSTRRGAASPASARRTSSAPWACRGFPPSCARAWANSRPRRPASSPTSSRRMTSRGDLHVHSDASSDATSSLLELASAARGFGRGYLAITDHSRSRPLGLNEARLLEHIDIIRWMDRELRGRPHLLTGIEVDILPNGSLDLAPDVLAELDCVVASVHSRFNMSSEEMTERIVRALRSGLVHVLGHPSGRLIGEQGPVPL